MAIKISGTTVIDDSRNIDNAGTVCATTIYGDGSNLTNLPVLNEVLTPTNTSPSDAATDIDNCPTLCASTYYSLYGVTMCCSQWQVDDNSDFSSPVYDLCCSGTSTQVTLGSICANCTYYWRVRYFDNNGCCSDYSTSTCFTTLTAFAPTVIGQSYGGGYYTGTICAASTCYYLVVAPNATGCACCRWKTANTYTGVCTEPDQLVNGYNNTYVYLVESCHQAGNWTRTRSIGGFSDWYLPARDELKQMYDNKGSMPGGEGYAGGAHWSSTERSYFSGCYINFDTGNCSYTSKDGEFKTRAIRRVPF